MGNDNYGLFYAPINCPKTKLYTPIRKLPSGLPRLKPNSFCKLKREYQLLFPIFGEGSSKILLNWWFFFCFCFHVEKCHFSIFFFFGGEGIPSSPWIRHWSEKNKKKVNYLIISKMFEFPLSKWWSGTTPRRMYVYLRTHFFMTHRKQSQLLSNCSSKMEKLWEKFRDKIW